MARVERSILIAASTDEIDAVALDGAQLPEWYVGIEQSAPDGVYPEVGGKVDLVYKAAGVSFNITLTVLELVRGDYILYKMAGMMTGRVINKKVRPGGQPKSMAASSMERSKLTSRDCTTTAT